MNVNLKKHHIEYSWKINIFSNIQTTWFGFSFKCVNIPHLTHALSKAREEKWGEMGHVRQGCRGETRWKAWWPSEHMNQIPSVFRDIHQGELLALQLAKSGKILLIKRISLFFFTVTLTYEWIKKQSEKSWIPKSNKACCQNKNVTIE